MNHNKLIKESRNILVEKLGSLKKHAKTGKSGIRPGDDRTIRTEVDPAEDAKLTPKEKLKLASHRQRRRGREEADMYWAKDYHGGGDPEDRRVAATKKRLAKHKEARGKKKKVAESLNFKQFCEALSHVSGKQLAKALKKSYEQEEKSYKKQADLPAITKYGDVDEKEYEKHGGRQYRLERARDEVRGEVARRMREQGKRERTVVYNPDRSVKKGGDELAPRKTKSKKKKLSSNAIIDAKPSKTKKLP